MFVIKYKDIHKVDYIKDVDETRILVEDPVFAYRFVAHKSGAFEDFIKCRDYLLTILKGQIERYAKDLEAYLSDGYNRSEQQLLYNIESYNRLGGIDSWEDYVNHGWWLATDLTPTFIGQEPTYTLAEPVVFEGDDHDNK